jgi:serine/threonine protein kinase
VCEGKLWNGNSDPEVQACGYFIASVRELFDKEGDYPDLFPCIIIYFVGSLIGFGGAALTDRVHLETLTPIFPLHTNWHEDEISTLAARAFGAFRLAFQRLQEYYEKLKSTKRPANFSAEEMDRVKFPYPSDYTDSAGNNVPFTYDRRSDDDKLIFIAKTTAGVDILIKFTRRYSEAAHRHCADHSVAPKLFAVKQLPGGWIMVVMEYLDEKDYKRLTVSSSDHGRLSKEVRRAIEILHGGNFVHGDIRNVNLMMACEWDERTDARNIRMVDFDWAGPEGEVCYPAHLNTKSVARPEGVTDGSLIKKEHDVAMVDFIFGSW